MTTNLKVLLASHLALLLAGVIIGYSFQKDPTISQGKTVVSYFDSNKLSLPKFNLPKLKPTNRIYFISKTKKERDTVYVSMPTSYVNDFLITQRDPISSRGNELHFRYFDPQMDKQVIDTYDITPSPWKIGGYLDISTPLYGIRPKIGPRIEAGYKGFKLNLEAKLDVLDPQASFIMAGTSIRFFGNN